MLLLLHNAEEALFVRGVLPQVASRLPPALRGVVPAVTYPQFIVALLVVTIVPFAVAFAGDLRRPGSATVFLLFVQSVLLVNVASHLASAAFLRGYAPGLATALAVNLPFSVLLLRRAHRERWVRGRTLAALLPAALLFHGPGLLAVIALAGWISRRF
ncbi:MAG TPA: HXXEE domain-containing protein [Longimicrobiaceae bacterium]